MNSILLGLAADALAVLIALVALLRWRVRRRRVDVRIRTLTTGSGDEVAIQIVTGDEPVLLEQVGIEFVGEHLAHEPRSFAWDPDAQVPPGCPDPFPNFGDGARVDSHSAQSFRLGVLSVREDLISSEGTVEVRPTALLWRPSTARRRPNWWHRWSKPQAQRRGLPEKVRASPAPPTRAGSTGRSSGPEHGYE